MIRRIVSPESTGGVAVTVHPASVERITINMPAGTVVGNTPYWVGVYNTTVVDGAVQPPTNGQQPIIEVQMNANYEQDYLLNRSSVMIPGPVYIAISSTENTYTATSLIVRLDVDIDEYEIPQPSTIVQGNFLTASHLVWSNAAAPHSLYSLYAVDQGNHIGTQFYLLLFATDSAPALSIPIISWLIPQFGSPGVNTVETGAIKINFGRTNLQIPGYSPLQRGASKLAGGAVNQNQLGDPTLYQGCFLVVTDRPNYVNALTANAVDVQYAYI